MTSITTTTTTSTTMTMTTSTTTTTTTSATTLQCESYYNCWDCTSVGCVWNFRAGGPPMWEDFEWCASTCSQLAHACKYTPTQC